MQSQRNASENATRRCREAQLWASVMTAIVPCTISSSACMSVSLPLSHTLFLAISRSFSISVSLRLFISRCLRFSVSSRCFSFHVFLPLRLRSRSLHLSSFQLLTFRSLAVRFWQLELELSFVGHSLQFEKSRTRFECCAPRFVQRLEGGTESTIQRVK